MDTRNRRMNAEWQLLQALVDANQLTFASIVRLQDEFRVVMRESPAWVGKEDERRIETEHALRYVYPRYYPSLPLEGYFVRPVLHVNVDPLTGFVCLWQNYQPAQTIVDAILIMRAVMACKAANLDTAHRMQQVTFINSTESCALPMPSLTIPEVCRPRLLWPGKGRRRLSLELHDHASHESDLAFSDIE
jgi:ubiquitin-protein ligase